MDLVAQGDFPFKETHNIGYQYYLIYDLIYWLCCGLMKREWPELQSGAEAQQRRPEEETPTVSAVFRTVCERGHWSSATHSAERRQEPFPVNHCRRREASTWTAPSWTCDNLAGLKCQSISEVNPTAEIVDETLTLQAKTVTIGLQVSYLKRTRPHLPLWILQVWPRPLSIPPPPPPPPCPFLTGLIKCHSAFRLRSSEGSVVAVCVGSISVCVWVLPLYSWGLQGACS